MKIASVVAAAAILSFSVLCSVTTNAQGHEISAHHHHDHDKSQKRQQHHFPTGGKGRGQIGPIVDGPETMTGETKDVTGSNDAHLAEITKYVAEHLESENSSLHYVQYKAEVQVVAGLIYTLKYRGNDESGACQEERTVVVYDKPWLKERVIKSDTREGPCS